MVLGRILAVLAITMIAISSASEVYLETRFWNLEKFSRNLALEFALSNDSEILDPVKHSKQVKFAF